MGTENYKIQDDIEVPGDTGNDEDSFEALYGKTISKMATGELVSAEIVRISQDSVLVDIGYKSDGFIPASELTDRDGNITVKVGDKVTAVIESLEGENGMVKLSCIKAARMKVWEDIEKIHQQGGTIRGIITGKVKGGLIVDLGGVNAFLPGSQADNRPVKNMDELIGQTLDFTILNYTKKNDNVVLSRKQLLDKQAEINKEKTMQGLVEGTIMQGIVKNVTDYGAFVDVGGTDGLLHVNDISWRRLGHPSEVLKQGDKVTVKVLRFDRVNRKLSLGMKQLSDDPWHEVINKYPVGTRIKGKVLNLTEYGAFVELQDGVEGMIHVSEMSWTKKIKHPSSFLAVGEYVDAVIIDVDASSRRISLGLKQTTANPWDMLEGKYPLGTRIKGKVKSITDFGVFVEIEESIDGLVHLSDISWTKKIKHPSEVVNKGDEIEAVILNINRKKEKISLGIKQLMKDPWSDIPSRYPKGTVLGGIVSTVTDFGVFIQIEEGIDGLISSSELVKDKEKKNSEVFKEGDTITAKVTGIDITERKISLSMRALEKDEQKAAIKEFYEKQGTVKMSIGDAIRDKLNTSGSE